MNGLRVLTKTQWRRLRNRYLNEQRKNMSAAKALLRKRKPATDIKSEGRKPLDTNMAVAAAAVDSSSSSTATAQPAAPDSFSISQDSSGGEKEPLFTPGLIVKISVEAGRILAFYHVLEGN